MESRHLIPGTEAHDKLYAEEVREGFSSLEGAGPKGRGSTVDRLQPRIMQLSDQTLAHTLVLP